MNILIIGDSWGVPNYYNELGWPQPSDHPEFLLRAHGHTVYNCALNGGSNLTSIKRFRDYIEGKPILHPAKHDLLFKEPHHLANCSQHISLDPTSYQGVDYIVWFHTELIREIPLDFLEKDLIRNEFAFDSLHDKLAEKVYPEMLKLKNELGAKLIVVGGQSPLDDRFFKYITPDFYIKDYIAEILKIELPYIPIVKLTYLYYLLSSKYNTDDLDIKDKLMYEASFKVSLMKKNPALFPDGCHPGREPYRKLTEWLQEIFLQHQS